MVKTIIVGVDPGTTVGIAILDTKGNIIELSSKRAVRRRELVKHITKFGKPVIVASDVNPLPKTIERLARSLGSRAYFPEVSLSNVEKHKLIKPYADEIKDLHQKDALAAALKAFRSYHSLFLKTEETLAKLRKRDIFDEIVGRLLKQRNVNILDTVRNFLSRKKGKHAKKR